MVGDVSPGKATKDSCRLGVDNIYVEFFRLSPPNQIFFFFLPFDVRSYLQSDFTCTSLFIPLSLSLSYPYVKDGPHL